MTRMANNNIIEIDQLTKRYPTSDEFALRGINLTVREGEFFGLLGPNGSGKTTMISILCGLIGASGGNVLISGKPLAYQLHHIKPLVGLVPQEIALYPTLSFKENLVFFGKLYGLHGRLLKERIEECLHTAGLEEFPDRQVGRYSGGMKRRANLAVSLLHRPKILFLDEPTVNVDPQSRSVIFDILQKLNKSGTTMIYTTHYMEEAQQFCDRITVIDRGIVIKTDTPQGLIDSTPDSNDLGDVFLHLTGRHLRD